VIVKIELINTGSELMLGRVLNSHQQWICRQLADRGYVVDRQVAVSDAGPVIQASVREALERADLVITTGGLGPTSDDLTRDLIARLLGRRLVEHPPSLENIDRFFRARNRPMPPSTRVQAMVPEGATVLPNAFGTAPGLAFGLDTKRPGSSRPQWLILLPGPPRELHPMFRDQVVPILAREFPLSDPFVCRTLRTTGLGESMVEERVAGPLASRVASGLELGYCARTGEVDVRLVARGPEASRVVEEAERICRELLRKHVFGVDDDSLEGVVVRLLTERGLSIGTAESCTGGYISHRITAVPGASAVFRGAVVAYHNDIKRQCLGVTESLLAEHGAVSEACAKAMAEGARRVLGVDFAISVTGIAGPSGGSPEKPVGTVFLGLASPSGTTVLRQFNPFERETFKFVTSQQALNLLRREVLEVSGAPVR
jgi:nicotinamide-nucleotide amidase